MSSYYDLLSHNPISKYLGAMDYIRDHFTHGAARMIMDSLPISGNVRNWKNNVQKAEDRYQNTGTDEAYSSPYASAIPFVNDAVGAAVKPARMARSLMSMYGAEVELDIAKERHASWEQSHKAANAWYAYEQLKQNRNR